MHWLPTTKTDLLVHLIQPVSELESNYDSEADRQAITFLFSLSLSLPFSFPPSFFHPLLVLYFFCLRNCNFHLYSLMLCGTLSYSFGRFGCSHIELSKFYNAELLYFRTLIALSNWVPASWVHFQYLKLYEAVAIFMDVNIVFVGIQFINNITRLLISVLYIRIFGYLFFIIT